MTENIEDGLLVYVDDEHFHVIHEKKLPPCFCCGASCQYNNLHIQSEPGEEIEDTLWCSECLKNILIFATKKYKTHRN